MGPRFGHRMTSTRHSDTPGVQDNATGRMVSAPVDEVIYAGPCDVQPGDRRRFRDVSGEAQQRADATVYFPRAAVAALHRTDDAVVIDYIPSREFQYGRRRTARVIAVDELSGSLGLAWLGAATDGVPA